jgi:hypothetical protein
MLDIKDSMGNIRLPLLAATRVSSANARTGTVDHADWWLSSGCNPQTRGSGFRVRSSPFTCIGNGLPATRSLAPSRTNVKRLP